MEGLWTSTNQSEEADAGGVYYNEGPLTYKSCCPYFQLFNCGPRDDPEYSKQVCWKYLESTYVEALNNSGGDIRAYLISNCAWTEDLALRTVDVHLDMLDANMLVLGAAIAVTLATLF